jgi:hypothetical protein
VADFIPTAGDRRRDAELRDAIDRCSEEYRDLRRRGRNMRHWMVGLSLWLTALSLYGWSENRDALDRIQGSRQEIIARSCAQHDAFVARFEAGVRLRLAPRELARTARRDLLTVEAERARVIASRRATLGLIEALQPRNPKRPDDRRPCSVIAAETARG